MSTHMSTRRVDMFGPSMLINSNPITPNGVINTIFIRLWMRLLQKIDQLKSALIYNKSAILIQWSKVNDFYKISIVKIWPPITLLKNRK